MTRNFKAVQNSYKASLADMHDLSKSERPKNITSLQSPTQVCQCPGEGHLDVPVEHRDVLGGDPDVDQGRVLEVALAPRPPVGEGVVGNPIFIRIPQTHSYG